MVRTPATLPRMRSVMALLVVAVLVLQVYFAVRIALWRVMPVESTAFMRTAQLRLALEGGADAWRHDWRGGDALSPWLERAVVASEDATFLHNDGVDWAAIREAWDRNHSRGAQRRHKLVGGSTITQQLAKNLFLSPQRSYARKAQELVITFMLEGIMGKHRILQAYLNSVEWGTGIYGAEAAAQTYFHTSARQLGRYQAARLAVMLPAPRLYQRHLHSAYLNARTGVIAARATEVDIPR